MKRFEATILFIVTAIVIYIPSSFAQFSGVREFESDGTYTPGAPISVSLTISGGPGEITVEERPPAAWIVQKTNWGGTVTESGTIVWDLSLASITRMTYVMLPTKETREAVEFSGTVGNSSITGDAVLTPAAFKPIGVFENHITLGAEGAASYDGETDTYTVTSEQGGGGYQLYREIHERGALRARMQIEAGIDYSAWIMFSDTLEGPSPFYSAALSLEGDGLIVWDVSQDYDWTKPIPSDIQDGWFEIRRDGDTFSASYFDTTEQRWVLYHSMETDAFSSPVYLGIGAWTHGQTQSAVAHYTDVEFTSDNDNWELYQ